SLRKYVPEFARMLAASAAPMAGVGALRAPGPAGLPGVVVHAETTLNSKDVGVLSSTTLRSLRETTLAESEFTIPSDYKQCQTLNDCRYGSLVLSFLPLLPRLRAEPPALSKPCAIC